MNPDSIARELVRALRGRRSQEAVNRRLKRTSNVLHAWERGTRSPSASDFFRLAALARVDVPRALAAFDAASSLGPRAATGGTTGEWVRGLVGTLPSSELARRIGADRNTVGRWRSGATEPRLPELLRVVDAVTARLTDFVSAFVDPEQLPSLRAVAADLRRQRELAYSMPWAHAVLRALELRPYVESPRHVPGFAARAAGISPEMEAECLGALAAAGQIQRRRGKWVVARVLSVDTREDPARNLALKRHWAAVSADRLRRGALELGGLFSYNLFAISEPGLIEIRRAHLEYFEKVRAIVARDAEPTRLVLANVQLVPLGPGVEPPLSAAAVPPRPAAIKGRLASRDRDKARARRSRGR